MSATNTTGWQFVENNDTTPLDLTIASRVESAQVRWRGVDDEFQTTNSDTYSTQGTIPSQEGGVTLSATYPSVGSGWTFEYNQYDGAKVEITNNDIRSHNFKIEWVYKDPDEYKAEIYTVSARSTATIEESLYETTNNWADEIAKIKVTLSDDYTSGEIDVSLYFQLKTHQSKIASTKNPQITVNGETISHTGTLNDGEETGWYSITALNGNAINDIDHTIDGSYDADYEIEYTYQPRLPEPILESPVDTTETMDRRKWLTATLVEDTDNDSTEYHAKMEIDGYVFESNAGTGIWEYYDGSSWVSFPAGGVSPGTKVRVRPDNVYNLGHHNWTATALDDWAYGYESDPFSLEILRLASPDLINPANNENITDRQPYYKFTAPDNYFEGVKYHFEITVSELTTLESPVYTYNSNNIQNETWEVYDGSSWVAFPLDGADPNQDVRIKSDQYLVFKKFYWAVTGQDGYDDTEQTNTHNFSVQLAIDKSYVLNIAGTEYNVYSLSATETSNGEIGSINFTMNNENNAANSTINYNDNVLLAVNDSLGNTEQFKARVKEKNPSGNVLEVTAITGGGILSERIIDQDYPSQDIGVTAKNIIDNYCSPLSSSNHIDTSTGIVAPIEATDKKPLKVFEDMRRKHGIYYFVDKDWDVHFYTESAISDGAITIRRGD